MTLLKALGFSLALTLVFTLVANTLPQVEGEAPKEIKVNLGSMTMESFTALGEELYRGKGTCTLCHKPPPLGRAPDIQGFDMVAMAGERLADSRYRGDAKDAEVYIRESMLDPGKYVVAGWGQKGSNDTVSPMPAIDKAPIGLSTIEIDAIIAYLQAKDGNNVTVDLPTADEGEATAATAGPGVTEAPTPAASAEEALGKYGCAACHTVLETVSPVGPSLKDVGARLSADDMRQSITDPNAVIAEGFAPMMPVDFADRMTVRELEMIVEFLLQQKG